MDSEKFESDFLLKRILKHANLLNYYDNFIALGGDDVKQLCEADEDEFLEIMSLVGMSTKPLHVRRLQKTLQIYSINPNLFFNDISFHQEKNDVKPYWLNKDILLNYNSFLPNNSPYLNNQTKSNFQNNLSTNSYIDNNTSKYDNVFNTFNSVLKDMGLDIIDSSNHTFTPKYDLINSSLTSKTSMVPSKSAIHFMSKRSLTMDDKKRVKLSAQKVVNNLPLTFTPKSLNTKKPINKEIEDLLSCAERNEEWENKIRTYGTIYGRFDSKRRDKPMSLHEQYVNEAAIELCLRRPELLTRRDELFPLARQVVRHSGYQYTKKNRLSSSSLKKQGNRSSNIGLNDETGGGTISDNHDESADEPINSNNLLILADINDTSSLLLQCTQESSQLNYSLDSTEPKGDNPPDDTKYFSPPPLGNSENPSTLFADKYDAMRATFENNAPPNPSHLHASISNNNHEMMIQQNELIQFQHLNNHQQSITVGNKHQLTTSPLDPYNTQQQVKYFLNVNQNSSDSPGLQVNFSNDKMDITTNSCVGDGDVNNVNGHPFKMVPNTIMGHQNNKYNNRIAPNNHESNVTQSTIPYFNENRISYPQITYSSNLSTPPPPPPISSYNGQQRPLNLLNQQTSSPFYNGPQHHNNVLANDRDEISESSSYMYHLNEQQQQLKQQTNNHHLHSNNLSPLQRLNAHLINPNHPVHPSPDQVLSQSEIFKNSNGTVRTTPEIGSIGSSIPQKTLPASFDSFLHFFTAPNTTNTNNTNPADIQKSQSERLLNNHVPEFMSPPGVPPHCDRRNSSPTSTNAQNTFFPNSN